MNRELELELIKRWQGGDKAAGAELCKIHEGMLRRWVHRTRRRAQYEDLLQHARIGLLRAATRFDPEWQCNLLTYARYCVYSELRTFLTCERLVRLPISAADEKAERLWKKSLNAPTPEELASHAECGIGKAKDVCRLLSMRTLHVDGLDGEVLESSTETPEQALALLEGDEDLRIKVVRALAKLPERERAVVEERLMRDEIDRTTFEELGERYGVTRQRIQQIEVEVKPIMRRLLRLQKAA